MIIKHSTGTIESVYDNKKEAEKEIKKIANVEEITIEKDSKEDKLKKEGK
jgi:hypothetical protein